MVENHSEVEENKEGEAPEPLQLTQVSEESAGSEERYSKEDSSKQGPEQIDAAEGEQLGKASKVENKENAKELISTKEEQALSSKESQTNELGAGDIVKNDSKAQNQQIEPQPLASLIEKNISDKELLETAGYESPRIIYKFKNVIQPVTSWFSAAKKWLLGEDKPEEERSFFEKGLTAIAKGVGYIGSKANQALNHPLGKIITFGLAVTMGAIAVAGTGGAALILPAMALGATVVGKMVGAGFEAQHKNKMESLEKQLGLLRLLEKKTIDHEKYIKNAREKLPESEWTKFDHYRKNAAINDEHQRINTEGMTEAELQEKLHYRNLPTVKNELTKAVAKNSLSVLSASLDLSSLPKTAATIAHHVSEKVPDLVSTNLDVREGTAGVTQEVGEQLEGADKEASIKLRINKLSKVLGVPSAANTSQLTSYVRGRLGSMYSETRLAQDIAERKITDSANAQEVFSTYKAESRNNKLLDLEVKEHLLREKYATRMAKRLGEALVGIKKEWEQGFSITTPDTKISYGNKKNKENGISI